MSDEPTPQGQLLIYNDGGLNLHVRLDGQTVWLTQAQMAELYQTSKQNISLHIQNVLDDKELPSEAVVKEYLTTAADGKNYRTLHYSLDMILAIGYRVRSLGAGLLTPLLRRPQVSSAISEPHRMLSTWLASAS